VGSSCMKSSNISAKGVTNMSDLPPDWYILRMNPEPWAVGTISISRSNGKMHGMMSPNANLKSFQNQVREEMALQNPRMIEGSIGLEFWYWRQRVQYQSKNNRTITRNNADTTNMNKGLEDALQGILYANDSSVKKITGNMCRQDVDVDSPRIIIHVWSVSDMDLLHDLPVDILRESLAPAIEVEQPIDQWAQASEDVF
jgi:Endodeoxyribonuclease RusA.